MGSWWVGLDGLGLEARVERLGRLLEIGGLVDS